MAFIQEGEPESYLPACKDPVKYRNILSGKVHPKCYTCGKLFYKSFNLKKHIRNIHEGHKDYKCETCSKSFTDTSNLKTHIYTIHEGYKDHKCESCDKSFSQAGNLKKHINTIHEHHKDYKCGFCGKSFSQAVTLKKHILAKHKGQKDYKCKSCDKSFSGADSFKVHIHTIHEGNKSFCEKDHTSEPSDESFLKFKETGNDSGKLIHNTLPSLIGESENQLPAVRHQGIYKNIFNGKVHEGHNKSDSRADVLKRDNYTIHEGHKDHKCVFWGELFPDAGNLKRHSHTINFVDFMDFIQEGLSEPEKDLKLIKIINNL